MDGGSTDYKINTQRKNDTKIPYKNIHQQDNAGNIIHTNLK